MSWKPSTWYPIAVAASAINLIAIGFTAGPNQLMHAGTHVALAVMFGAWAARIRPGRLSGDTEARLDAVEAQLARLDALEGDVGRMRQELSEAQERLDFAERVLVKAPEVRRPDQP